MWQIYYINYLSICQQYLVLHRVSICSNSNIFSISILFWKSICFWGSHLLVFIIFSTVWFRGSTYSFWLHCEILSEEKHILIDEWTSEYSLLESRMSKYLNDFKKIWTTITKLVFYRIKQHCNMDAMVSFNLFMVYIPECKQQRRTMK
jgi:hypothetical protein